MKRFTTIAILGLLLAACAGGAEVSETFSEIGAGLDGGGRDGASVTTIAAAEATTTAAETVADEANAAEPTSVDLAVSDDRKVIRQARLQLQADDTRAAFDRIVALAEAAGGFVTNATVSPVEGEDDHPEVAMTLRIPADRLTETMTSIKGTVEEVISESQGAEDVTDQFIDLEARLTNLRALEVELRALLTEVRQQPNADPDELLRVFNEISNVRGEIEQIQGRLNYLDDVVALATLEIGLTPTPAVIPIVEDTWEPVEAARDSLRSLVNGLQGIADWGINFLLFTLPMLALTLGIPLLIGFVGYRLWRKRRPRTAPSAPLPTES